MPVTRSNINTFKFKRPDGSFETVRYTGHEVISPKMTPIYATLGDSYEKVRTDLKVQHKQYTGSLSEAEREKCYDMVEAEEVFYIKGNYQEKITILEIDFDEEIPHSEPIGLMFEWIVAKEDKRDVEQ